MKHVVFHQNKGKPPFTSCNVQVLSCIRIPVAGLRRFRSPGTRAARSCASPRSAAVCRAPRRLAPTPSAPPSENSILERSGARRKPGCWDMAVVVKTVLVHPILVGIGEFTTHFRTYFSGDREVHWGTIWILTHGHTKRTPFLGQTHARKAHGAECMRCCEVCRPCIPVKDPCLWIFFGFTR